MAFSTNWNGIQIGCFLRYPVRPDVRGIPVPLYRSAGDAGPRADKSKVFSGAYRQHLVVHLRCDCKQLTHPTFPPGVSIGHPECPLPDSVPTATIPAYRQTFGLLP